MASSIAVPRASVPRSILTDSVQIEEEDMLSEGGDGRGTIITNPNVLNSYASIMDDTKLEARLYRGNIVDASCQAVIKHLVEDWKDHINDTYCPHVSISSPDIYFQYCINGTYERTKYFAIDGIYLDLLNSSGVCCSPNVRIIFPNKVLANLNMNIQKLGRWTLGATASSSIGDAGLSFVTAKVDNENPPSLTLVHTRVDQNDCVLSATHENVGLLTSPDLEPHIYMGCGFFRACVADSCNLSLNLVGVHALSIQDGLLKKNNLVNATAFGVY
jgi:hypothetical protein